MNIFDTTDLQISKINVDVSSNSFPETDSVFSTEDDFLKNAEILSLEEAKNIVLHKMMKLQSLYNSQLKKFNSKTALLDCKADLKKLSGSEMATYKRLLKFNSAHNKIQTVKKCSDISSRKRRKLCSFSPQGCSDTALPFTDFCENHILNDEKQVLFACCISPGCDRPLALHRLCNTSCSFHYCDTHSTLNNAILHKKIVANANRPVKVLTQHKKCRREPRSSHHHHHHPTHSNRDDEKQIVNSLLNELVHQVTS